MTEAEAAQIVRRIVARPTNAAFDTVSGSVVRLFARLELLEKRVRRLERRDGFGPDNGLDHLDSTPRRGRGRPLGSRNRHQPPPAADDVDRAIDDLVERRRQA